MWKIIEERCMGCGVCTLQCNEIEMEGGVAHIIGSDSSCLARAAKVCPRQIIIKSPQ